MEIKLEIDNDVIVLKPIGNLIATTVNILKEQIAKLVEKKYVHIILDLSRVQMIDSTGLGAIMVISRDISSKEGLFVCVGLNENVNRVFHLTRFDQKIALFETKTDAMSAFLNKFVS